MTADRLTPTRRRLWVVRWIITSGRDVRHRYFTREYDADRFLAKLQDGGWVADIFITRCEWKVYR